MAVHWNTNCALEHNNLAIVASDNAFFIRRGIKDSEPVLIEALNKYDGPGMALAFLNCGNPKLENAGHKWMSGYGGSIAYISQRGPKWGRYDR